MSSVTRPALAFIPAGNECLAAGRAGDSTLAQQTLGVTLSALRALQHWVARDAVGSRPLPLPRASTTVMGAGLALGTERRRLPAGAVVGFAVEARVRITCLGGELWVTGPGTGDQILGAGQSLPVVGPGRVVAEALRDSRFVVIR
jgi:hypothetical protein